MALDVGSRRAALKFALAMMAGGWCEVYASAPQRDSTPLRLEYSITGARVLKRTDPAGNPVMEDMGPYVPLIFPVAVAGAFGDIYIADAGSSSLYRFDRTLGAFALIPGLRIGPATRLQSGPDGSLYILDPFRSQIHRFSRGGMRLGTFNPRQVASRYTDFVVHPLTGRVYAVDSAYLCIDEIEPLGNIAIERLRIDEAGPIAMTHRGELYTAGANCGCVSEWMDVRAGHRAGRQLGAGKMRLPRALAVIGPQLVGLDGERNLLLIHEDGVDKMSPRQLGMLAPENISAAQDMLLVADGAGQRVSVFRQASGNK